MSVIIPLLVYFRMDPGAVRFLVVVPLCVLCSGLSILFVGCDSTERKMIFGYVAKMAGKFTRKTVPPAVIESDDRPTIDTQDEMLQ